MIKYCTEAQLLAKGWKRFVDSDGDVHLKKGGYILPFTWLGKGFSEKIREQDDEEDDADYEDEVETVGKPDSFDPIEQEFVYDDFSFLPLEAVNCKPADLKELTRISHGKLGKHPVSFSNGIFEIGCNSFKIEEIEPVAKFVLEQCQAFSKPVPTKSEKKKKISLLEAVEKKKR